MESRDDTTEGLKVLESFDKGFLVRECVENAPDGVCIIDAAGNLVYCNQKGGEIIGYTGDELIGKNLVRAGRVASNSVNTAIALFKECRKQKSVLPQRIDMVHRDGRIITVEISANAITHDNQTMVLGFVRDATERKKAEDIVLENGRMLYSFINHANDAVFLMKHFLFADCNLKALDMFGCKKEEIIGAPPHAFSTGYQYDGSPSPVKSHAVMRMAMEGVPQVFEWRHCRKDGTPFDTEVSLNRITLGGEACIQAIVRDVTERKKAQEETRHEREKLQILSDNAPFGMVVINKRGDFTYMNARFTEILGYDLADVSDGRTWFRRAYPDPGYRHRAIGLWMEDFTRRTASAGIGLPRVFNVTCKDGTIKTVNLVLSMLSSGDYLMTCEDITEIKRLESRLNQAQKMESLGTLAGGIIHDFNNILSVLMGYATLIKTKIKQDVHLGPYTDQIISTSRRAADLIRQLLAFARQQPVALAAVDINQTIRSIEKLLLQLLAENIEMRLSLSAEHAVVEADKSQIEQIFFNLVSNAKDAMDKGGMLVIETQLVVIDNKFGNGYMDPGTYVVISVSDTGYGMDEATREKVFDPFFTTKEVGKGTGLGLATVYGIVKQHSGYITVYSEPGQGATFRIYLPAAAASICEEKDGIVSPSKGEERILIAEDEEGVRSIVREVLWEYGYQTIEAVDGQDAVEKYRLNPDVDLVILDLVMPRKNGREAYDEIRAINPEVKVLFTSGYTRDIALNRGIEDDKFHFMPKPLVLDKLLLKIREILD